MAEQSAEGRLTRVGLTGALAALAAVGTMLIRVPIPATTGYFNIGDIFVILAGLWLGPWSGLAVGAIGPTLADAIGFPVFIPATMVTKGLEGFLVGLIGGPQTNSRARKVIAAVVGGATIVVGYFVFEAFVYPRLAVRVPAFAVTDLAAAIVETIPNTVQAVIGAVGALALWRALAGYSPSRPVTGASE